MIVRTGKTCGQANYMSYSEEFDMCAWSADCDMRNLDCNHPGCNWTTQVLREVREPTWFSCLSKPGQPNNNAMGVLLEDGETVVQMQPAYRCGVGAPLLARFGNGSADGCPQQFPNVTSIFGDGALVRCRRSLVPSRFPSR